MSSILVLPRSFSTTLTQVSKAATIQAVPSGTFQTVTMNSIDSDIGNNWDAGQNRYVVPSSGLYQITATLRANDNQSAGIQFGVGVHTSVVDGPWFLWHAVQSTLNPNRRTTYPYIRTGFFEAGETLRLFTFSDQGYQCGSTVLNIFRVA